MSVSVWQQSPKFSTTYSCDVAVIGAGIVGAYTAYTLAQAGRRVALLESRFPAAGATGRNAGFSLVGAADNYATGVDRFGRDRARELWKLTQENQRKTRAFLQEFNLPLQPGGSAILAIDKQESAVLGRAYKLMREDGFEVSFSPTDPFERGFGSALLQPDDFGFDPVTLVQALIENAPDDRVRLFAPAEVFAIHEVGDKLQVDARGVRVECEQIALCTNAYSRQIAPYFDDKIAPVRAQILLTAPLGRRIIDKLAYANYGYEYFRQLEDGSFLLGGGRSHHKELEVGYDEAPTAWLQATLEQFLQKYFPDVAKVPIVRRWAGTMGFSVDGLPLTGRLPVVPGAFLPVARPFVPAVPLERPAGSLETAATNIFFAVGFTGHGLGWGMVTADAMIGQMLGQRSDGGLFDVRRLYTSQPAVSNLTPVVGGLNALESPQI